MAFDRLSAIASASLTGLTVPKNRRPRFELQLKILDLNNVPLVSGSSFIKWHLPHSSAAEHRGRTSKCHIKDHKVSYDYTKTIPLRLTIDKKGVLENAAIHFEVIQEYSSGARSERIVLGNVKLNLTEYIEASEMEGDEEDGVCRRYLMQESKINSTLKICIRMKQTEGDRNFIAPPLKTAPVFGGIAGIMAGEQGESDDIGHMPSLSSKSRETGELQDLYRRTLAAYWAAQPGELKADECIEDIFAGGDGWGDKDKPYRYPKADRLLPGDADSVSTSEGEPSPRHRAQSGHSDRAFGRSADDKGRDKSGRERGGTGRNEAYRSSISGGVTGRGSLEQQAKNMKAEAAKRQSKPNYEVDEFEVRENLRSWHLPGVK